jgi:hypothetical protein
MAFTHYIPFFAVESSVFRGQPAKTLQAVCGTYIAKTAHTNEPSCPVCQRWLEQDAADTAETAEALGLTLENGVLVPRLTAKGERA